MPGRHRTGRRPAGAACNLPLLLASWVARREVMGAGWVVRLAEAAAARRQPTGRQQVASAPVVSMARVLVYHMLGVPMRRSAFVLAVLARGQRLGHMHMRARAVDEAGAATAPAGNCACRAICTRLAASQAGRVAGRGQGRPHAGVIFCFWPAQCGRVQRLRMQRR